MPSLRHEELKKHIDQCRECKNVHQDLLSTLNALHGVVPRELTQDLSQKITEVSESARKGARPLGLSRGAFFTLVPVLLFLGAMLVFPQVFPWMTYLREMQEENQFVRYFPLLQGATDLIDEQTAWFGQKSPFAGSLWEEGGLSPDEFEKAFQKKSLKGAEDEDSDSTN